MIEMNAIQREHCPLCHEKGRGRLLEKGGGCYVKCSRCGLVYSDPATMPEGLKEIADEWAAKHHGSEQKLKWEGNAPLQEMVYGPRMWQIDQYKYFNRLLEVGCSTGEFLEYASRHGWQVEGCEIAEHTAQIARERVGCEIRRSPFEKSGYEEDCFDVVVMWDVIEHLFDPLAALEEAWRVLRPGGLLALTTPNYDSLTRILIGPRWEALIPKHHLFVFDASTIKRLVSVTGGRVVALRAVDLNPFDIISAMINRKSYGFEDKQKNIEAVKDIMLRRPGLALARAALNTLLSATRTGDVLEVYAERAP